MQQHAITDGVKKTTVHVKSWRLRKNVLFYKQTEIFKRFHSDFVSIYKKLVVYLVKCYNDILGLRYLIPINPPFGIDSTFSRRETDC